MVARSLPGSILVSPVTDKSTKNLSPINSNILSMLITTLVHTEFPATELIGKVSGLLLNAPKSMGAVGI